MQYGVTLPDVEARTLAELAQEAEAAGWDGVFVWDIIWGTDPWISLAAAAWKACAPASNRGRHTLRGGNPAGDVISVREQEEHKARTEDLRHALISPYRY